MPIPNMNNFRNSAVLLINALEVASFMEGVLVVKQLSDLPAPVAGEIALPPKNVLFVGMVDIGSNALVLSTGTLLRGLADAVVVSSATGGVVRATNLTSNVVIRELSIVATAGPCLNLVGTTDYQLNLFFVALLGASAGTVSGFEIQAFKDCFIDAASGLTLTGTTNKIFLSQCPFYGITAGNAAITFAADLVAQRVDMVQNFFKHGSTGTPIKAEAGYTVGYGRVTGTMVEGPLTILDGLSSSDINWFFRDNDRVKNSRVAGQSFLTAPATTIITTIGAYVPVVGPFTVTDLTERFILNGSNELEYVGGDPVLITFNSAFSIDPANNNRVAFRASKNGTPLDYSQTIVEQGAGAGAGPRLGAVLALIELQPGDRVGLSVANLDSTDNVPWLNATFSVIA